MKETIVLQSMTNNTLKTLSCRCKYKFDCTYKQKNAKQRIKKQRKTLELQKLKQKEWGKKKPPRNSIPKQKARNKN
jgi:hypothetical protein